MFGLIAGAFAANVLENVHVLSELQSTLGTIIAALLGTTIASSLLRRDIPDRVRIGGSRLDLLRGSRVVRHVDLGRLKEVSEVEMSGGRVLLVADAHRHITLPSIALAESRDYEAVTQHLVKAMERIDPSGTLSRTAVRTGRLRETISQQPVRGTFVIAGLVTLASVLAFSTRAALSGEAFPEEAMGALNTALVLRGEVFRLFSYLFLDVSAQHLAICAVGILYIGSYLEKLLGWERVMLGFVAGAVGGAVGYMLTPQQAFSATGAGGALFGLLGLLAAVALLKRRRSPTLMPHSGFWMLSILLAILLPANSIGSDLLLVSPSWLALFFQQGVHIGGSLFGFLTGLAMIAGVDIPAPPQSRANARPFAILGGMALLIGVAGNVVLPRLPHGSENEIITQAMIDLPHTLLVATQQNDIAYPRLADMKTPRETVEIFARIAAAAAENSHRRVASILDTLAVARYRQGEPEEARAILSEALKLDLDPRSAKAIKQHQEDIENGATLRPDPAPDP
jgi:membrane associated rhomboid family serine protease